MEELLSDGVVSSFLDLFPGGLRPWVEIGAVVLLAVGAFAAIVNPIIELAHRVWRAAGWFWRSVTVSIKGLFTDESEPPLVQPVKPEIPEERTIWELRAPTTPTFPKSNGIPIISVANLKGGVGKTTIVANLAVYFRERRQAKVLLIDFDYQGSLSETIRGEAGYSSPDLTSHYLIRPPTPAITPRVYAREMRRGLEDVFLYPTTYPFATIENNLLAEWLASRDQDLMYRLCSLLRGDAYQDDFCAVLIDCPPRLTAGSINALCASTHLLVPTTLDDMSAQAAEYFLGQVSRMKQTVFPGLKVVGIVPSIHYSLSRYLTGEQRALDRLVRYGQTYWKRDDFVLVDGRVPRIADISNYAGVGVASLRKPRAMQMFSRLGEAVEARL